MYSIFNYEQLDNFRKDYKIQPYRIRQIYHNIFKNSIINFWDMTDLPKEFRNELNNNFYIVSLYPQRILETENTTKIAFKTKKWLTFETVIMYHKDKYLNNKINRITICLSSQIWCAVWCKFCVTWKMWFIDNLDWTEIIEQILRANNYIKNKYWKKEDWTLFKTRNVVFMWMGEPMLNYENVKKSINFMLDQKKLNLSKRHITISTSWIIPWIKKLLNDNINVKLAVSLHSANQITREKIIPISSKYKLNDLMLLLDEYVKKTDNRIFYEYIMIDNLTDTKDEAKYLVKLLKNRLSHVNLIPYNENPVVDYKTSSWENIIKFKEYLEKNWITVTIRNTMWEEIKWACWQLWYENVKWNND